MKPVARPSVQHSRVVAQKENLYFVAGMFAILLAGDLVWWHTKQISDDFEHSTANMYSVPRNEARKLEVMKKDIDGFERDLEVEFIELDEILTED